LQAKFANSIFHSSKKIRIMKYLMLITVLSVGILSTSCAQGKKTAPAAVQTAFKAKFPTVQKAKWEMEHEGEWEAEFKSGGKGMSANYKADGTWLETETELKQADLPQAVKDAVAAQFAGSEVEKVNLVEAPGQPTGYEVELEKGETTVEALFSAEGALLSQKTEEEGEDDEKGKGNDEKE
jgi:Putative beta-lactamase-inhibitor-like, PepSY-like